MFYIFNFTFFFICALPSLLHFCLCVCRDVLWRTYVTFILRSRTAYSVGHIGYTLFCLCALYSTVRSLFYILRCNRQSDEPRCRPPPTISWSQSGRSLSPGENGVRYRWSAGNHTLHITNLTVDDDGRYECNASNSEGHRVFAVDLRVYGMTAWFHP